MLQVHKKDYKDIDIYYIGYIIFKEIANCKNIKIASNSKYNRYQRGLVSMVYNFFDKRSKGSGVVNEPNYQLENELHKPIIRKC